VAEITGYSLNWLYELVWGYDRLDPASLGDKRQNNAGRTPLLNDQQQALLWQALQEPPSDGGLWTGSKVARWMSELLGKRVAPQRGWDYLRGLDYVRRRPRPAHIESDPEEQEQWKKNFADH
jgi:transposase